MVAKNFPKPKDPHTYLMTWRPINASLPVDLFNELRNQALAEDRSLSNMVAVLIKRGLKATNVPK